MERVREALDAATPLMELDYVQLLRLCQRASKHWLHLQNAGSEAPGQDALEAYNLVKSINTPDVERLKFWQPGDVFTALPSINTYLVRARHAVQAPDGCAVAGCKPRLLSQVFLCTQLQYGLVARMHVVCGNDFGRRPPTNIKTRRPEHDATSGWKSHTSKTTRKETECVVGQVVRMSTLCRMRDDRSSGRPAG